MKAEELRIGNLLERDDEVFAASAYTILLLERNDIECNPIPITEEWLVRLGFEKQYDDYIYDKGNFRMEFIVWADDEPEWKLKRCDGVSFSRHSIIKTKHVHQLQNLYFALTGEELLIYQ